MVDKNLIGYNLDPLDSIKDRIHVSVDLMPTIFKLSKPFLFCVFRICNNQIFKQY